MLRVALRRPGRVLAVGSRWRLIGLALDSQTEVVSDVERLVPQDLQAVRDLQALQRATGVAGEVDVIVEGEDLTDPKVVAWMRDYQARAAGEVRLLAGQRLRQGRAVPGAVAHRPVPRRAGAGDAGAGARRCSTRCRRTSRRP